MSPVDDAAKRTPDAPLPHEVTGTQLWPQQRVVELHTKGKLSITSHKTVIPFDVILGLAVAVVQLDLQAKGITLGFAAPPSAAPPT